MIYNGLKPVGALGKTLIQSICSNLCPSNNVSKKTQAEAVNTYF
jgi:hypothetical protein